MEQETRSVQELISELKSDETVGITQAEALERLERYGRNELASKKKSGVWLSFFAFVREPMIWLLVGASSVYFILGDSLDAWIMLFAAIPIALMDVVIEYKTESTLEKLRKIASPRVRVVRGGAETEINNSEVVIGDIILAKEGDVVPADAVVLESSDLRVDESSLTGESVLVDKHRVGSYTESVFNNRGVVFAGTTVISGRVKCIAWRTGADTQYGKIGSMISSIEISKTPLQKNIESIVKILGIFAIVLSILLFAMQVYIAGNTWSTAILDAVSLAIAAIPEEFPVTFVLFMSLGAWFLARKNALVKRMAGVETLGCVDVICTDKTGTLTTGRMSLTHVYYSGQTYESKKFLSAPEAKEVLEASTLACEINPFDPMERSIFDYVRRLEEPEKIQVKWILDTEYAFDHKSKYMSHIWKRDGRLRIYAKGSVEGILRKCSATDEERDAVLKANERMAHEGMRILAVATNAIERVSGRESDEKNLQFIALLAFSDPIRTGVPQAVSECKKAGIRVVMITGDHKITARSVAHEIGLDNVAVMEGSEIIGLPEEKLNSAISTVNVFSRVIPEQKLAIVSAFQKLGRTVAVTGDGINDAPALRKADIGVAMGLRGTEVAREAATMVLLDDNFVTIVAAVRQGRIIYENLRKAFSYLIAFHTPIFLSALAIPLLDMPLLLMPIHIIFLELILHPIVSIVFQQQPGEEDIMLRKPRSKSTPLVDMTHVRRLVFEGFVLFMICFAAYWFEMPGGEMHARSAAFTLMVFGEVFIMVGELAGSHTATLGGMLKNKALIITILVTTFGWIILGSSFLAQEIFKVTPLTPAKILAALFLSLIPLLASEAWKRLFH